MPRIAWLLGFLLVARTIACVDEDESFRSDVLYCENALAHAKTCCPELKPLKQSCRHMHEEDDRDCSCSDSRTYTITTDMSPTLFESESEKLLDSDCEAIAADEGCAELQLKVTRNTRTVVSNHDSACAGGR